MNVNRCFLLGNLTRDPELKALTNGGSIATFTLATNRRVKKGDEKVEEAEYHNVVVFGKAPKSELSKLPGLRLLLLHGLGADLPL